MSGPRRAEEGVQLALMLAVGAVAAAASWSHVLDLARGHGQGGWLAWADAACIETAAVAAGLEIRRRHRAAAAAYGPGAVLVIATTLQLAAQVASAQRTGWGVILAAVPAVTFLTLVKLAMSRTASTASTAAVTDVPAVPKQAPPIEPPAPPSEPPAPPTPAPAPAPAPRPPRPRPTTPPPAPAGQRTDEELAAALTAWRRDAAAAGEPAPSKNAVVARFGIGRPRATTVLALADQAAADDEEDHRVIPITRTAATAP